MEIKQELNNIYKLYSAEKFSEAKALNDKVLVQDSENMYAKRYANLLTQKIKQEVEPQRSGAIPKVKWKALKCPHCVAKISFSALSHEQREKLRNKQYNNLELKCPYCHTEFTLQNRKASSLLWIKVWDKIQYNQKSFRAVGYVQYNWTWYEWKYSGKVTYLEWILLWEDNSYLYFSEWFSMDEWSREYEFEFSEKIIPKFSLEPNFDLDYVKVNGENIGFKEYNEVSAKSIYGENSKSFQVWEKVQLYPFVYDGEKYVIEKEISWTQSEAWIYATKNVSEQLARSIFSKQWESLPVSSWFSSPTWSIGYDDLEGFGGYILLALIAIWSFPYIVLPIMIIGGIWYFMFHKWGNSGGITIWSSFEWMWKYFALLIFGPVYLFFIVMPLTNIIIENKQVYSLEKVDYGKKYELTFQNEKFTNTETLSYTTYDYWGRRTYYKKNEWLKFSIKSDQDLEIMKKIQKLNTRENDIYSEGTSSEKNLVEMFNEILYKLK